MTRETYNWAVDKLLDAYNKGKLKHCNCNACAVGNLLETDEWEYDFYTSFGKQKSIKGPTDQRLLALYKEKGFKREELMKIEEAFETSIGLDEFGVYNYGIYCNLQEQKEGQFIGLTAVLKLMSTMVEEDIISEETINSNQERLIKVFEKVNV